MGEIDLQKVELSAAQMFGELLNCGFVIVQCAPEYKILYVNDIFVHMLGYDQAKELEDIVKNDPLQIIHPEDARRINSIILQDDKHEDRMRELSYRMRKKDGSYLWITKRCTRKTYDSGRQFCLACYTDITYLMEEKERLKRVLKNIPAGLLVLGKKEDRIRMIMANDYVFQLRSTEKKVQDDLLQDEMLLEDLLDMICPEDRKTVEKAICQMFDTRSEARVEFRADDQSEDDKIQPVWMLAIGKTRLQPDGEVYAFINLSNITNLKETEERVRFEQQKNQLAMQNSQINFVMWDYDPSSHSIYNFRPVNHKTIYGPTIEDLPDSLIEAGIVAPEYADTFRDMFYRVNHGEEQVESEIGMYNGENHELRLNHFSIRNLYDKDGKISGGVGCSVDITESKMMEDSYQSELECMLNASEFDLIGKARINVSRNYVEYCQNEGLDHDYSDEAFDSLISAIIDRCITKDQKNYVNKKLNRQELIRLFQNRTTQFSLKYQRKLKDQSVCWVKTQIRMYPNPTNGNVMMFMYMYNIQNAVLRDELIQHIIGKDYEMVGQITLSTGTLKCIIGSELEDQIHQESGIMYMKGLRGFVDYYVPEWSRKEAYSAMCLPYICGRLRENGKYVCSFSLNINGQIKRKYWNFAFLDESETRIVVTRTDITQAFMQQQKQAENMKQALDEAKKASKAKSEFLSRMSHDIRTPLNSIINMNRFAQQDIEKKIALTEDLKQVETAGKFLLGLVNDILDMSRIESGRIELHPEAYEYERFLEYIDCIVRPLCNQKNIHFLCDLGEDKLPIYVDITRFNQVFFNILTNAVKYTPEGGTVTFEMKNSYVSDHLLHCDYVIRDNGIGMSEEFQRKAFEPFERECMNEGVNEGSGLGLAIAARIIRLMNGKIRLKSEQGKGTEVLISLDSPVAEILEKSAQVKAMCVPQDQSLAGRRALVVEDFKPNREIIVKLLEEEEIQSECAENGRAACEQFLRSEPGYYDIIMMDIRMPIMDGLTATRLIRKSPHPDALTIPIVAMTANAFEEDKKQSLDAGINEHIAKPIDVDELKNVLHQILSN